MSVLSSEEIEVAHQKLPVEWVLVAGNALEVDKKFADFAEALVYVNRVGELAESANHHPDITLGYGAVHLKITTHSEGGLTKKDFALAEAIENI